MLHVSAKYVFFKCSKQVSFILVSVVVLAQNKTSMTGCQVFGKSL